VAPTRLIEDTGRRDGVSTSTEVVAPALFQVVTALFAALSFSVPPSNVIATASAMPCYRVARANRFCCVVSGR